MRKHATLLTRCARLRHYSSKFQPTRLWAAEDFSRRLETVHRYFENHNGNSHSSRYPRVSNNLIDARKYLELVQSDPEVSPSKVFHVAGRVAKIRVLGSKLVFVELETSGKRIQIDCSFKHISEDESDKKAWDSFRKTIQEGDHWAFTGTAKPDTGLTGVAKYTLKASHIPTLLAPRFHNLPDEVVDSNTLTSFPQLSLMIDHKKRKVLKFRHSLERAVEQHLESLDFIRASTPILAGTTGGATAAPFVTSSRFLNESQLKLRIATELDLKMLVTAGFPRVYELGRVFRNEGIDAEHNPEFTTCEFYMAYANLDTLVDITESLFVHLKGFAEMEFANTQYLGDWTQPFPIINFIPTLESQIRHVVSDFDFPNSLPSACPEELLKVCERCEIPVQAESSTSHVLDLLAARFIEPLTSSHPTFIAYHPSITSPLAKSFIDPESGHEVAARMELFVNGTEYVNFYEEENDPLSQMRKFINQNISRQGQVEVEKENILNLSHRELFQSLSPAQQYYIRVMEMGMPPTAGWGAGIDRMVMLFTGSQKISEVLPFGNVRHVLAMGD